MNQILYVQDKKTNSSVDTKKVVLFFAVSIIIFGLIFLGQGAYFLYKNKQNTKVSGEPSEPTIENPVRVPTINLTKTEDNKVVIKVEGETQISNIIYGWNNDTTKTIEGNGATNIEEIIDIPTGENTLNISVIDSNGNETNKQETYIVEQSKPIINLSVVGNDIKITVTSEEELSYVTYKWNSEQEKKEDMKTYEDRTKFEKSIEIPRGENTLKIVAVDKNENKTEKTQEIKGITKPKNPKVVVKGQYIDFTVESEENIATVEFSINGKKYLMDKNTFGETKEVHYKVPMIQGMNYFKITAKTVSGGEVSSVWKYEYKGN